MSEPASQRLPANQVGLIFGLLLAAWALFIFYPRQDKPAPPVAPVVTESKLKAVGLDDNPDWEGLPELFAIWAGHARWQDQKVFFAYWHPGSQSYAYYFEATRQNDGYRFRVVSHEELARKRVYYYEGMDDEAPNEVPELKSPTSTHPFAFLSDVSFEPVPVVRHRSHNHGIKPIPLPARVEVDLKQPPLTPPKPEPKESDIHGEPKK